MEKKLTAGLKVLLSIFIITGVWTTVSLFLWVSKLSGFEKDAHSIGRMIGILIKPIIIIIVNFAAAVGLLRFKKWGLGVSSVALILSGISFATSITRGFNTGFNGGVASHIVIIVISFAITGVIIFKVIKYLYKEGIKSRYI